MAQFERHLSHTSLSTYRRCKTRYKWGYLDNYEPLPSLPLIKGGCGHAGLGAWYKALADAVTDPTILNEAKDLAFKATSDKLREYEEKVGYDLDNVWEEMAVILDRYFDWALANDDFVAHEIEYKFELEIDEFMVIGYLDGIVERSDGTLWILEHKFTKQVRAKHLEIDPQISLYMLAARASGFDVRGAFYNVVRTTIKGKAATEPVVRLPVFRNNEGLEQIVAETVWQMREMREFHEQRGKYTFRTPTMDCSWDCGFHNACLAMNDVGDPIPALGLIPLKEFEQGG